MKERRRDRRITLRKPVLAAVDTAPVFVLDVSSGGLRVAHRSQLPPPGGVCRIDLPADGGTATLDCAIVHTVTKHASEVAATLFQTGLRIVAADLESRNRMQRLVASDSRKK